MMDYRKTFPPPSEVVRVAFAKSLLHRFPLLRHEDGQELLRMIEHYDTLRTEVIDNLARQVHELVSVSPRPPMIFTKADVAQ